MGTLENWGDSPAADRIRAQVAGMAPSKRWSRVFMVLQAFTDDSTTAQGNFVLAGHLATAEEWLKFSNDWEPLAKAWGILQKDGNYVFKMAHMAQLDERMDRVAAFYRVIEKYDILPFAFGLNRNSFKRAVGRLSIRNYDIDMWTGSNAYYMLFNSLVANLVYAINKRPDLYPPEDKIDFYFDEQSEKKQVWKMWDEFIEKSDPAFRERIGINPRFERDTEFMPLQAADFWAWWNSRWMDTGRHGFEGAFAPSKTTLEVHHILSEDEMVHILKKVIWSQLPDAIIYEHRIPGGDRR